VIFAPQHLADQANLANARALRQRPSFPPLGASPGIYQNTTLSDIAENSASIAYPLIFLNVHTRALSQNPA
jgi:hypothetical protein